jgi:CubicO group peptidase (beta-lactamase class C family)
MKFPRTASLAAAALLVGAPAHAQDRTRAIDSIFSFATAQTPGCAVGVSQRGRVIANRAYGLADVDRRAPLGQSSRFDIGSTQKQFTAAAILLLAEDGRLALSDDIRKYLPELPDYGHTVTIDHLLTHTSGIRDWTGLLPMAEEGTAVLPLILRQRGLNFTPGTEWSYSSSGFELAKEIVARVSGMPFAEFARRRLFEPLGMRSSAYVPDILQAGADAALGYQKEGAGWRPYMRLGNNRGGGAIVSTMGDLVTWTDAIATGRLSRFVTAKIQEPARLANGRKLMYARGLMVDSTPGGVVVSHSGGAAGFSTWMGHVPQHGLSVAVACNFDPVSATALAARVSDLYLPPLPAAARAEAAAAAAGATGVDPSGRAGTFFDERTGEPILLQASEGRLRIANGPPLVALSAERFRGPRPSLFFRSQDAFEMAFTSNDQLEIRSMEGQVTRYRRARPWTPTSADLQAADGRYESAELGSVFEILPRTGGLVMRFERAPEKSLELTPVERDTYMLRGMIVRFRRDAAGKVVRFDYGNPVVRNLGFTRLGDRTASAPAPSPAPAAAPPAVPSAAAEPAPPLEGLVGDYELAPGRTLTITLEDGRLHGQPSGGEKRTLAHVSGATFSAVSTPITLTFTLGADGRATGLVMRQNGMERTLTKVR